MTSENGVVMHLRQSYRWIHRRRIRCSNKTVLCWLIFLLLLGVVLFVTKRNGVFVIQMGAYSVSSDNSEYLDVFPSREFGISKKKRILLWIGYGYPLWKAEPNHSPFEDCEMSDCMWTTDKSEIEKVDAVFFDGVPDTYPTYRAAHQVWILSNQEPPYNYFAFLYKLNNIFNWTMSYRTDSDVFYPYYGFEQLKNIRRTKNRNPGFIVKISQPIKKRGIFWISSNYFSHLRRHRLIAELQNHISVDTYGKCGELDCPFSNGQCNELLNSYKFKVAVESGSCADYISEKTFNALESSTIPIVYGGADYSRFLPPKSYINIHDFKDFKQLAEYIRKVDANVTLYNEYFRWRDHFVLTNISRANCNLCAALHDKNRPAQVYRNLKGWVERKDRGSYCKQISILSWASNLFDYILFKLGI